MVKLTDKEFKEEHTHLLKILKNGSKLDRLKEYIKQKNELKKEATAQQFAHDAKQTAAWVKSGIKKIDLSLLKDRGQPGKAYRFFAWGNREFRKKNPKLNKILNLIANPAVPIPVPGIGVAALGIKGAGGLMESIKKFYKS